MVVIGGEYIEARARRWRRGVTAPVPVHQFESNKAILSICGEPGETLIMESAVHKLMIMTSIPMELYVAENSGCHVRESVSVAHTYICDLQRIIQFNTSVEE